MNIGKLLVERVLPLIAITFPVWFMNPVLGFVVLIIGLVIILAEKIEIVSDKLS
jgi:hypothetical protein